MKLTTVVISFSRQPTPLDPQVLLEQDDLNLNGRDSVGRLFGVDGVGEGRDVVSRGVGEGELHLEGKEEREGGKVSFARRSRSPRDEKEVVYKA